MIWSESTAKIDAALAKAQSEMQPAVKKAEGQFRNAYADLQAIMSSAMECLTKNGCSLTQGVDWLDGTLVVKTRIAHEGEYLLTYFPLSADNKKSMNAMQAMGSASTYGRRYAIMCALGIAPMSEREYKEYEKMVADDDGASSGMSPLEEVMEAIKDYGTYSPVGDWHISDELGAQAYAHGLQSEKEILDCRDYRKLENLLKAFKGAAKLQRRDNGSAPSQAHR